MKNATKMGLAWLMDKGLSPADTVAAVTYMLDQISKPTMIASSPRSHIPFSCTTKTYDLLYARWLEGAEKLVHMARVKEGDLVLDLCGGSGVVSEAALQAGAAVVLLDLNPRARLNVAAIKQKLHARPKLAVVRGRAEDAVKLLHQPAAQAWLAQYDKAGTGTFDKVICRQAIGYLDTEKTFEAVAQLLRPGGMFVFNNFIKPRWRLSTYQHNESRFLEASACLGTRVAHLQARWPIGVDVTTFRWHPQDVLLRQLRTNFVVELRKHNRSVYYICHKPL
jgi:SAM-dependent methyltransferase